MARPTFMQSLLGRPSQTYAFPHERDYYSSKANMVRLAQEANQDDEMGRRKTRLEDSGKTTLVQLAKADGPAPSTNVTTRKGTQTLASESCVTDSALSQQPPSAVSVEGEGDGDSSDEGSSDDDDDDVFYTPNTSPRISMASATFTITAPTPREKSRRIQLEPEESVFSTRTPLPSSRSSVSSLSSTSLDAHSIFSSDSIPHSDSTKLTIPQSFDAGHGNKSSRRSSSASTASSSSGRKTAETCYTGDDWAKDVRWLTSTPPVTKPMTAPYSNPRQKKPRTRIPNSMAKTNPSIMMKMTALLEEDEEKDAPLYYNPRSSVLISGPRSRMSSGPEKRRTRPTSSSGSSNAPRKPSADGSLRRRRSRSLESRSQSSDSFVEEESRDAYVPELPSHGTAGYTSLTLPRAPQPAFGPSVGTNRGGIDALGSADGKVDLTRSGVAQTTMASVEVVRGLSELKEKKGVLRGVFGRKRKAGDASVEDEDVLGFTSYRKPPDYVPGKSVLVQVWAIGLDGYDWRLVGGGKETTSRSRGPSMSDTERPKTSSLGRSMSLRSTKSAHGTEGSSDSTTKQEAPVGYIPGRSFVGRVLECGWEVKDEVARKGEWVVGLLDIRKCGALQEFIVADRHRIHRVPQPSNSDSSRSSTPARPLSTAPSSHSSTPLTSRRSSFSTPAPLTHPTLTLEELALLPLCGVMAYRAMRTIVSAYGPITSNTEKFSLSTPPSSPNPSAGESKARRVLVLRGHDGVGAMAVQMLVKRGWRVSVHAPLPDFDVEEQETAYMNSVETRARSWGADEVIFGGEQDLEEDDAPGGVEIDPEAEWADEVGVIGRLIRDGDVFDAVLDTVGGKQIWEASEKLLRGVGCTSVPPTPETPGAETATLPPRGRLGTWRRKSSSPSTNSIPRKSMGLFTTLVGDHPIRVVPTAGDLFRAGMRSMKNTHTHSEGSAQSSPSSLSSSKVGYTWMNVAQDVDWEGEDARDRLGAVLKMAIDEGVRPWVGNAVNSDSDTNAGSDNRVVPFERAPKAFSGNSVLANGGTVVVTVVP